MNCRTKRFGKAKRSFKFYLLLISIIMVWNFGLFSAGGEEDIGMLAFNTMNQSSLAGHGSPDLKFATSSGFKLKEGFPRPRLFTPNGDTSNEEVTFEYENIKESSIVCWIYDIKGAVVRQLDIVETGENKFTWNGKDEDGNVAPSGIYIYQIEVEGKTINGTIVLAK
jgi:gliding motility-associated-like protein